ncbi:MULTISPECIES: NAD-dependent epimerase/dehydratase family protein [unclassified Methylophilus]|uniref:NAD-dependent epimerase/dehydratase family protein n=1 Tax=unclassified Methylophilus TaxID=2630143 RepID=UPI001E63A654|nr:MULTISPECIES: NAD-dependent epimerase/dehydratase family protein [unclassified Methylophilus]
MNILITGASGFVGDALMAHLKRGGHTVTSIQRHTQHNELNTGSYDCLIHLAARAHVVRETVQYPYPEFKEANVDYSMKMAQLARQLQVRRFIFLSTIGVNGHISQQPFTESDTPKPHNDYARTKWEAELALKAFFEKSETVLTIIRPPLVYGPNPKANFKALLSLCRSPFPLPLGAIHNRRSLIGIDNLCQFIALCCHHPAAAHQTFLISDDHDVSITELVALIRKALHHAPWLVPIPTSVLKIIFSLLGKRNLNEQLLADLQIDTSKAKQLLNWGPAISFDEGIKRAVTNHVA